MPRLACVYIAETLAEAQAARRQLAGYGIDASIEASSGDGPSHRSHRSPGLRVMVPPEDFEFSREVVEEFEAKQRPGRRRSVTADPSDLDDFDGDDPSSTFDADDHVAETGVAIDWPRCPRCRRPRLAICPACQTAGSRFPLAGDHSGSSAWLGTAGPLGRPLLVCSTCDHPFMPEFYRRCEGCGHEFPDGIDAPKSTPVEEAARQGGTFLATLGLAAAALYIAWRLLR